MDLARPADKIIIPIAPVTKKNHQQIMINRATGRPFVIPSPQYQKYEASAAWYIKTKDKPIDYPVNIECKFYMPTHRKVDLTNLLEAIDDVLVKCKYLEDDNSTIIVSHDGSRVLYDKENPRTEVIITEV